MSDHSRTYSASTSAGTMACGGGTYYTISDAEYFLGTVMLLNSLRLTGNEGKLFVLDAGLDAGQPRCSGVTRMSSTSRRTSRARRPR